MLLQWLEFSFFVNCTKQKSLKTLYKTIFMYHFFVIHASKSYIYTTSGIYTTNGKHESLNQMVCVDTRAKKNMLRAFFVFKQ